VSRWVVPGRVPLGLGVVEVQGRRAGAVTPRLTTRAIREVAIGATDCHVQNQVEVLVERSVDASIFPGVEAAEAAFLPEAVFGGVDIQDDVLGVVEVGLNPVLGPNEAEGVHGIAERLPVRVATVGKPVWIVLPAGSPVEGRAEGAAARACVAVAG